MCSHSVWINGLNSGFIGMNQCDWDSAGFTNTVNILWDFSVWIVNDWRFLQVKCCFLRGHLSVAGQWYLKSCMSNRDLVCVPVSLDCRTSGWDAAVQLGTAGWAERGFTTPQPHLLLLGRFFSHLFLQPSVEGHSRSALRTVFQRCLFSCPICWYLFLLVWLHYFLLH